MSRVKRGTTAIKRRRSVLKQTKGYRYGRRNKERQAKEAIAHAGTHAFAHRRDKKNNFRRLWQIKINAAVRPFGFSYSAFARALRNKGVKLDRKTLADLAEHEPATFEDLVKEVQ